jgi:hypothetical protein
MTVEPDEWFILGETIDGKKFRPSDWSERLCSTVCAFANNRSLTYSSYARPALRGGKAGVLLSTLLQDLHPQAYRFVMDFAKENRLVVEPASERFHLSRA